MVFFQNLLDIAAYNAAVIFFAVNPDIDRGKPQRRRLFLEGLAIDMITPAIDRLQPNIPQPLLSAPPVPVHRTVDLGPRKRGRCALCDRSVDRKTVEKCTACNKFICRVHARMICSPTCQ
jgi:hypothetical protein